MLDFQGILAMLSAILGQQFFMECYYPLGEVSKVWKSLTIEILNSISASKGDGLARSREQCSKFRALLHHVDPGDPCQLSSLSLSSLACQFRKTIRKMLGVEKRTSNTTSVTVTTKLEVNHLIRCSCLRVQLGDTTRGWTFQIPGPGFKDTSKFESEVGTGQGKD